MKMKRKSSHAGRHLPNFQNSAIVAAAVAPERPQTQAGTMVLVERQKQANSDAAAVKRLKMFRRHWSGKDWHKHRCGCESEWARDKGKHIDAQTHIDTISLPLYTTCGFHSPIGMSFVSLGKGEQVCDVLLFQLEMKEGFQKEKKMKRSSLQEGERERG